VKFIDRAKRRNAGWYWYTTDRHLKPGRESGYVGESQSLDDRDQQHIKGGGRYKSVPKSWNDLRPKRRVIHAPWWLSWKWSLRRVETLLIVVLRPRYNWAKNPWKRHRVGPKGQAVQRQIRDARRAAGKPLDSGPALVANRALVFTGALVLVIGLVGSIAQR
jgi:hypothetical protein